MSWDEVLRYASGPGVNAIVGALLSVLVDYWPWFGRLTALWKRAVTLVLCLVVPLSSAGLGVATVGWPATWEGTFWPAVLAGFTAFVGSQVVHSRKLGRGR
jgi:hypothetical protein